MASIFSPRADVWLRRAAAGGALSALLGLAGIYYYAAPEFTRVGYAPVQPIPFSHLQHVGQLGLSCLYCHTGVERGPVARVPDTQTCMNCHQTIKADSPLLEPLRVSWSTGDPVHWERVHRLPDYVGFNHAVHVRRGVGCVSCHGKINEMPVVRHEKPLSMGWCLDCHRHPEGFLRPASEVVNFDWQPPQGQSAQEFGRFLKSQSRIRPPENCAECHR